MTGSAIDTTPAPLWVRNAGKPWVFHRTTTPFTPKHFDVGDTVTFQADHGHTVTGQVWSGHYAAKTKWVVADQIPYAVHERDLIEEQS